ncbi:MAG TPA: hypothetical protein V6C88_18715 [Chroococcidiopsis sp.]
MMSSNVSIRVRKRTKRMLQMGIALIATFALAACTNRLLSFAEETNVLVLASPNVIVQVDGSITPDEIIQVYKSIQPNHESTVLTEFGDVSPKGDRVVKVLTYSQPEHSTVTVSDADNNLLTERELPWLVGPVRFSPDSQKIVASGSNLKTQIWDVQLNPMASFTGHEQPVESLQISPDSNHIFTFEPSYGVSTGHRTATATGRLLDFQGTQLAVFEGLSAFANGNRVLQFSPDGQHLLTLVDGRVQLSDIQGTPLRTLNQDLPQAGIAQFSPDGRSILAVSEDKMYLWDLQGNLKTEFRNWTVISGETITSVQISQNSQWIATGSSKGLLRLWNGQSNQIVTLQAHEGAIHSLAFNPEDSQIASLGEKQAGAIGNNDIRLWNLQGQLLEAFENSASKILGVSLERLPASFAIQFAPAGKHIIATQSGQLGTKIQWQL